MTTSRRGLLAAAGAALLAACSGRRTTTAAPAATPSPTATPTPSPTPTASATPSGPAVEVEHGPRDRRQVALTFHGAGDPALGVRLLEEAEQAGVALTVLAVGTWLQSDPSLAKRVLQGGHELGNHTMTHPVLHRLAGTALRSEVEDCRDLLQRLTGAPGGHFRPSGGSGSTPGIDAAAARAGYGVVLGFDVDPRDYQDPGADAVVSRTLAAVRPGSIVSLHLGHAGTVTALPRLLAGLREKGLQPVTASRLLA